MFQIYSPSLTHPFVSPVRLLWYFVRCALVFGEKYLIEACAKVMSTATANGRWPGWWESRKEREKDNIQFTIQVNLYSFSFQK